MKQKISNQSSKSDEGLRKKLESYETMDCSNCEFRYGCRGYELFCPYQVDLILTKVASYYQNYVELDKVIEWGDEPCPHSQERYLRPSKSECLKCWQELKDGWKKVKESSASQRMGLCL